MGLPSYLPQKAHVKAFYKFEDNGNDASSNGLNLTMDNMTYEAAVVGKGAVFNGSSGVCHYDTGISLTGNFTISFWAKDGTTGYFINNSNAGVQYSQYLIDLTSNKPRLAVYSEGGASSQTITATNALTSVYKNFVFTRDGTNLNVYCNGVSDAAPAAWSTAQLTQTERFNIGAERLNSSSYRFYFNGKLDEVGVWDVALSAAEALIVYKMPKAGGFFLFLSEAWERHKNLWTPDKKLILPEDLGFSY
jgi:hypothetical protein